LVGCADRHTGWLAAAQPVLGMPEDIGNILDRLEVHGVVVDRIVVAVPFWSLSPAARQALLLAESARNIQLRFLAKDLNLDFENREPDDKRQMLSGTAIPKQQIQSFEIAPST